MYSALIGLFLLAQAPDVPDVGQRVVAELRNGYRIEGVLVEKDGRFAVLSLDTGELRLNLKRVRHFHLPESVTKAEKSATRNQRLSVPVPSAKAGEWRLSFSVPEDWKKVEDESRALTYVDSREEMRFGVEELTGAQSLWKITARIRRSCKADLTGFDVKQERFGNRWTEVRTWVIDFEYSEGKERYRERRLYLDFGTSKRIFVFRTRASSFPEMIGHFETITSGMALENSPNAPVKPDTPPKNADPNDKSVEEIEQLLEAQIKQALEG